MRCQRLNEVDCVHQTASTGHSLMLHRRTDKYATPPQASQAASLAFFFISLFTLN